MPNLELDLPGGFRLDFRSILRGSRLGYEVTSQTQAVQYTAAQMQARDWLGHEVTSQTQAVQYTAVKTFHLLLCPRYESREPDVD